MSRFTKAFAGHVLSMAKKRNESVAHFDKFEAEVERFADGSCVAPCRKVPGRWVAWWADKTPLRGCSETTGLEVDWLFHSREEAIKSLQEAGEGPPVGEPTPQAPVRQPVSARPGSVSACGDCGEHIEFYNGSWHHMGKPRLADHRATPKHHVPELPKPVVDELVSELKRLHAAATPGIWECCEDGPCPNGMVSDNDDRFEAENVLLGQRAEQNWELIMVLRNRLPEIIGRLEALA